MIAYDGNDIYTVDNFGDVVVEWMGDGNDTVYANVNGYTLHNNVEILSLNAGAALAGTGNAQDNQIYGNALNNLLNGGAGPTIYPVLAATIPSPSWPARRTATSSGTSPATAPASVTCCGLRATAHRPKKRAPRASAATCTR